MKYEEMLVAIHKMEEQLNSAAEQLNALKEMILLSMHEEESVNESQNEVPVINEEPVEEPVVEEREELPAPPKVVYVDMPKKDKVPDEETIVGCQILSKLPDFYDGTCRSIVLQKQWHDNSDKVNPRTQRGYDKLHINRYKVVITAEDIEGNPIGTIIVHWNTLAEWHAFLISRGINKHKETDNPHTNWMPNEVSLCID